MHLSYPGIKLRIVELIEKLTKEQHIIKQAEFPAMGLQKNSAQNARYLRGDKQPEQFLSKVFVKRRHP